MVEEVIGKVISDNKSLWDLFLMLLWSLSIFLGKILEWLSKWVGSKIALLVREERSSLTVEITPNLDLEDENSLEVSLQLDLALEERLFPKLPKAISFVKIWPRMVYPPNLVDLFRFRRINGHWYRFVTHLLDWSALIFVYLNIPGYL